MRRSCGRPIQICLGGRTRIRVSTVSPGAISAPAGVNLKSQSSSASLAAKAT